MTEQPVTEPEALAANLAALASAAGEAEWGDAAAAIAGASPAAADGDVTFHALAITGLELVEALSRQGRWREARTQAEFLSDYFTGARQKLHAVAGIGFQGLLSAVRARDREDMDGMAEFLREIFADPSDAGAGV